jgi:hypothetical protein
MLVQQADGNAQCGDALVTGQLLGRIHHQRRDARRQNAVTATL